MKNILDVTYGCMVYQEQVLEIVRTLAGYSLGKADSMRRVISKKKPTKWLLNVKTLFTAVTTEIYRVVSKRN